MRPFDADPAAPVEELWVGCGPSIIVVDCDADIRVTRKRTICVFPGNLPITAISRHEDQVSIKLCAHLTHQLHFNNVLYFIFCSFKNDIRPTDIIIF